MCHLGNWHSLNYLRQFVTQTSVNFRSEGVNEEQNTNGHLTNLFVAIVVIVGTNQKLTQTNHNCTDGCNVKHQSLIEFGNEQFHVIRVWEVNVENSSTTNVVWHGSSTKWHRTCATLRSGTAGLDKTNILC